MALKLFILAFLFILTLQTSNLKCDISGCATCSFPDVCGLCSKNYILEFDPSTEDYSCHKISVPRHCQTSYQDGVCEKCSSGYFLTSSGKCNSQPTSATNLPQNCLWSVDSSYCSLCRYGFTLRDGKCMRIIPIQDGDRHCLVKYSPSICQICGKDYLVSMNGRCVLIETARILGQYNIKLDISKPAALTGNQTCSAPNCDTCSADPTVCEVCAATYTLNSARQCTLCNVPGCLSCSQEKNCTTCMQNYQQISPSICLSCMVNNCASCSSTNVCATCKTINGVAYTPSSTGNQCLVCNKSASGMNGCLSCSATNSCGVCSNGLQLFVSNGSGICIQCSIQNCNLCGMNGTQVNCQQCAAGYSANGQSCNQCLFPCSTCNSNQSPNNCATCQTPIYFSQPISNGTCIKNSIPNCINYNPTNTTQCSACQQSFTLNTTSNTCVSACQLNCKNCNSFNVCKKCQDGFVLSSNGTCSPCQITGCSQCSDDGTSCKKCFGGFYNLASECKLCPGYCKQCTSGNVCTQLAVIKSKILFIIGVIPVLAVCQPSCVTCSALNPWVCQECASGFFLNNGNCFRCSSNCLTCDQNDKGKCLSCYPNNFLVNNTCKQCNQKCLSCQGATSVDTCTSCRDGFYLTNGDCVKGCPKNCYLCSSSTTCTQCLSGYSLYNNNGQVVCAPCTTTCRTCADGQPAACLSCGVGFYLSGTTCMACTANCQSCTAAGCNSCIDGFFLTSALTCAQNCAIPCATCSSTDPTKCTSCIAGYNFNDVSSACDEVIICNGGCSICPLGFSLKQGQCLACSTTQCQSCNPANLTECYSCQGGYFLADNGTCQQCDSSCKTCLTGSGCLSCADSYTTNLNLPPTSSGYQCIKCNTPCLTCLNTPDYCTSCIPGYGFFGWKCASRFYFAFQLTLLITLEQFNRNYFTLIELLTITIGGSDSNAITVLNVREGSVIFDGGAAPTAQAGSSQATDQLSSLNNLIKSNSVNGMPVGASSLTVVDNGVITNPDFSSNQPNQSTSLGIILGICIPLGVLLIAATIVIIIRIAKRDKISVKQNQYDQSAKQYNKAGERSEENNYV